MDGLVLKKKEESAAVDQVRSTLKRHHPIIITLFAGNSNGKF